MWFTALNVLIALCEICAYDPTTSNDQSSTTAASTSNGKTECSFDNLRKVIGHNDFSVLGRTSSCMIFYVTGDQIESGQFKISMVQGEPAGCIDPMPLFYRQNDEYKILVAQKRSVYMSGCQWQDNDSFHSCSFSRAAWKKTWVMPEGDVDEIVGHVTDINTDILHVLYKDEEAVMFDSMYNLSSGVFVKESQIDDANFKLSSFDSDLMRLYYESEKLGYEEVKSDAGLFTYKSNHRQLLHFNESDFTAFSFSNKYYVVKKKYRTNQERYFVGNEEKAEQLCISNTASSEALILQLFVGKEPDVGSVHAMIRKQISPKRTTTSGFLLSTTTASACSTSTSTLLFILLLTFAVVRCSAHF